MIIVPSGAQWFEEVQ